MQTKKGSLIEVCCNTASGFLLAYLTWKLIFVPHVRMFGWNMSTLSWWQITYANFWFTLVSIVRSYLWRRFFNRREL